MIKTIILSILFGVIFVAVLHIINCIIWIANTEKYYEEDERTNGNE